MLSMLKVKLITYIILEDVLLRPLCNLELVDAYLDWLSSSVEAAAQRKGRKELVGLSVSCTIILTEVERLHDEDWLRRG